jgi:uncharacterized lipoprotein YddW (UPF0748 family)
MSWLQPKRAGIFVFALLLCFSLRAQQPPEFRALWADTFHAGMRTSSEVTAMVNAARNAHCNAIIVEVRKRGDAYYNSNFEPKATDVSPQSFDPLADLITKAHTGGPRVEVHAWITTYLIWNNQGTPPSQATHPYNLHPEWLSQNSSGATWDGGNYQFDQSHPEVQKHVYNVAMDIITRYDVDGLNFDYVRFSGNTWGYHPVAVDRFRRRFNTAGTPSATDTNWLQFRRDQVSGLVRKVYLNAIAVKPQVKISADTICFAPGITNYTGWTNSSAAWNNVLQDWRGWMEEGILDLNIPMMYFDQRRYSNDWSRWSIFAKEQTYGHHVAIGQGSYLNTLSNMIYQLRTTRTNSPNSNAVPAGVAIYSYAVPVTNDTLASTAFNALVQPSGYDPVTPPIFTNIVLPPDMPWKTSPTVGHMKGTIRSASTNAELDGALVSITGPRSAARTNDATGFYGFVNLSPGNYTVTASYSNYFAASSNIVITPGVVTTLNFALVPTNTPPLTARVCPGSTEAIVAWDTLFAADAQVSYGLTASVGDATWKMSWRDPALLTNHAVLLTGLAPNTNYFCQAHSRVGTNVLSSALLTFSTAGEIIIDNPDANLSGTWTTATSSADKYGGNYAFATAGTGATATFTPPIATPGLYDVYVWYPQGGNRPTNAPWTLVFDGGTNTGVVNQTINGGGWRLMAANKLFARGTNGFFQWQTTAAEAAKVVMADAVRFVYVTNQEPPLAGNVPRWWSEFYYGASVSGASDTDGDSLSASQEYLAGSDPTRPDSQLQFGIQDRTNNVLRLDFAPFHPGRIYELQFEDVLSTNGWQVTNSAPTALPSGEGVFATTNPASGQKFYRLRIGL